jgi:hypothetical protein
MGIKYLLTGIVLLSILSSCKIQERIVYVPEKETIVEYVDREIPVEIKIPGDTIIERDSVVIREGLVSLPSKRLDTKHCYALMEIKDSRVLFELYQKEGSVKDTIIYVEKIVTTTEKVPMLVPAEFSWWERLYLRLGKWAFGILSLLTTTSVLFVVGKLFFNLRIPKLWK